MDMKTLLYFRSLNSILVSAMVVISSTVYAGTQWISSDTYFNYNASSIVLMAGGQTVTTDDSTGWILSGRLANSSDQNLNYGSSKSALFLKHSLIEFSSGYVSDAYLGGLGSSQLLYYGSSRSASFAKNSHIKFSGGYVSEGYLSTVYGSTEYLPYTDGGDLLNVNISAKVEFEPGSSGYGVMSKCVLASAQYVDYAGFSGNVLIRGSGTFTSFENNYISEGVSDIDQYMTNTSSALQHVLAGSICSFVGGYLDSVN